MLGSFEALCNRTMGFAGSFSPIGIAFLSLVCFVAQTQPAMAQTDDWNEYVTGMTAVGKPGAGPSCPPIVWLVEPGTPAAKAGISPGDRLIAVDGHRDLDAVQARPLLRTKEPKSSEIELEGDSGRYTVNVSRIKGSEIYEKHGWKLGPDGDVYPSDATEAEMERISKMPPHEPARERKVFNVGHYPSNQDLYYPGFELFVWDQPQPITVGAIEEGPAKRAGVHYGDPVVSVNGVNPNGKSMDELENLFSSPNPVNMTLLVNRDGSLKTFAFALEKASDVATENHKRAYKGRMIPSSIPAAYLHCFDPAPAH